MSSLFNYELDEKNIRSTLQEVRQSVYSESAWNDFEDNYAKPLHKPSPASFIKLPDIHLNINRNVVLPLFFILALVGVSAIMLSFIDFKSADGTKAEKKLEPNANNYKTTVVNPVKNTPKKAAPVIQKPIVKTEPPKPEVLPQVSQSTQVTNLTNASAPVKSSEAVVSQVALPKTNENASVSKTVMPAMTSATVQNAFHKPRRKKAEKVPEEQLETIKAPTLIKSESEESEPELEIKVD